MSRKTALFLLDLLALLLFAGVGLLSHGQPLSFAGLAGMSFLSSSSGCS